MQDIKYITAKPLARLDGAEFARLVRAEQDNFVKLQITTLRSESSPLFRDWKSLFISNGFSVVTDEWNQERAAILKVRTLRCTPAGPSPRSTDGAGVASGPTDGALGSLVPRWPSTRSWARPWSGHCGPVCWPNPPRPWRRRHRRRCKWCAPDRPVAACPPTSGSPDLGLGRVGVRVRVRARDRQKLLAGPYVPPNQPAAPADEEPEDALERQERARRVLALGWVSVFLAGLGTVASGVDGGRG